MNSKPQTTHLPNKGRPKGALGKGGIRFRELCEKHGYDPGEVTILAALNKLPCGTCNGKGKTKYQPAGDKGPGERMCQSCWGSGFERMAPKDRIVADIANAGRIYPQLKAIEHSGEIVSTTAAQILAARKKREAQ